MIKINKKGAFELSFSMLFSIIAGAVIIFIAIYAATQVVTTSQATTYSEAAVSISNLLNPVVNSITSAFATKVEFRKETRIYLNCSSSTTKSPYFGAETIAFSEQSGFIKKWLEPGAEISRYNKYVFSDAMEQGKTLYIFSKPIYFGYRVDDLLVMNMDNYCFVGTPSRIQEELEQLNMANLNITNQLVLCPKNSIKVCFGIPGCNITVTGECDNNYCENQYDAGRVEKNGKNLYYTGNLIYAAIFSSPEIYSCNIERLGKKTAELGKVYKDKIEIISQKNCNTQVGNYIDEVIKISSNLTMNNLANLDYQAKLMDDQNKINQICKIYSSE